MLVGFKRNSKKREDVFYKNVTVNAANSIHPPKLENVDLSNASEFALLFFVERCADKVLPDIV